MTAALVVMGGGGHAAVVTETARAAGWTVLGYVDDDEATADLAARIDLRRLGALSALDGVLAASDARVHAAVGSATLRQTWLDLHPGRIAEPIVHPTACVSPSAALEAGVFVGARAVVNARAVVERGVIVNTAAIVEHDVRVGAYAHIAPGAVLGGAASVGRETLIGSGAVVILGVSVGARAILGAGAVAIADVPDQVTAVGVPATIGR